LLLPVNGFSSAQSMSANRDALVPKPLLLVAIHGSLDHYASGPKEILEYGRHFSIHIICSNSRAPAYDWPPGITVERVGLHLPYGRRPPWVSAAGWLDYLVFLKTLDNRIARLKPSVVYSYDSPAFVAASLIRRYRDFRLVYHCYDQWEPQRQSRFSLRRQLDLRAFREGPRASLVIYPEPARADYYMQRSGDRRPPTILPNYPKLDLVPPIEDFDALIERRFARRELLYTGSIDSTVALPETVAALAGMRGRLRIFGSAKVEPRRQLEELAERLALTDRVSFCNWLPHHEMIAASMDATIGLSLHKPVSLNLTEMVSASNKLWEYAARGIPAVVPDTPNFRSKLSGEEWVAFADLNDPESIARAVRWFLDDRDRYVRASRAARLAFEQRYNFERVAPSVIEQLLLLAHPASSSRKFVSGGGPAGTPGPAQANGSAG
jgi:glycosyltransferase involved in cell wall biosynthesis